MRDTNVVLASCLAQNQRWRHPSLISKDQRSRCSSMVERAEFDGYAKRSK